jgi:hypothetical protein
MGEKQMTTTYKTTTVAQDITDKLNGMLVTGAGTMHKVEQIMNEFQTREDKILHPSLIQMVPSDDHTAFNFQLAGERVDFTEHSLRQMLERLGFPKNFYDKLQSGDAWSVDLLMHNFKELSQHMIKDRVLIRQVGSTIKGYLSSKYKIINSAPMIATFIEKGLQFGFKPVEGWCTDTRHSIKLLHPDMYSPTANEVVCFGLELTNSDYGAGAFQIAFFIARIRCSNLMRSGDSITRSVHLGRRFKDDQVFISQETHDLDTKAMVSAIKDIVETGVEQKAEATCKLIEHATEQSVSDEEAKNVFKSLRLKGLLTKDMEETANSFYQNVEEINMLPKERDAWRLSNVLSLMAQSNKITGDKALDLQTASHDIISNN